MTNALQNVNKANTGLCPHGLPPSACPICSKMMGGGGRVGERPQKAGEMSYHQCAMIGAIMKARANRIEMHEKNLEAHALAINEFQNKLEQMTQKMLQFANLISNNFIFKPVAFTIINVVVPILNIVKNIPNLIKNISTKFIDIQDKLNAIFGEAKAFLEKKISQAIENIKSKLSTIFKIFKKDNAKDDDTKVDDDKKIFNFKKIFNKLLKRKPKDDTKD